MTQSRFTVVPAAYVVFLRDDAREVLLQLRRGTGYMDEHWACAAAGHVEVGETVHEAAAREATEEVDVADAVLVPLTAMQRTNGTGLAV
ncbi:MAG: NUDIX domain-containing protein, partial [Nocardioides sp.]